MAVLDTASIQMIWLNLDFLWDKENLPSFSLGSILTLRTWQKLYSLSTSGLPLHLAELARFADRLSPTAKNMHMTNTYLLSGTWAEVLDTLRKKPTSHWEIGRLSGAECDSMSDEEKETIFGKLTIMYNDNSPANQYLRGIIDMNPLRDNDGF